MLATRRFVSASLTCVMLLAALLGLTACQASGVKGKTFYHFSASDGKETVLSFDDADGWHMANDSKEAVGTWKEEGENIVLVYAGTAAGTLVKTEDGNGYIFADEVDDGAGYYENEDQARQANDNFVAALPACVQDILESANWVHPIYKDSQTEAEEISFVSGSASYAAGTYTQETATGTYLFKQGPSDGDWTASDHSGAYELTVESFNPTDGGASYKGTLSIDGVEVSYWLKVGSSYKTLTVGDTFTVEFEAE